MRWKFAIALPKSRDFGAQVSNMMPTNVTTDVKGKTQRGLICADALEANKYRATR